MDNILDTLSYEKSYNHIISGMNGSERWLEITYILSLPPKAIMMFGRPATKRTKDVIENQTRHTISNARKKGK